MNLTEFSVGTIVVKTKPRLFQQIINEAIFQTRVIDNSKDMSYIGEIYKIMGFGNNFAYVKLLTKYSWKKSAPNKLEQINCNEFGEGWEELVIPEGLTLEQICIK